MADFIERFSCIRSRDKTNTVTVTPCEAVNCLLDTREYSILTGETFLKPELQRTVV